MKALLQRHSRGFQLALMALLIFWAVWYARPLDIYDLTGGAAPEYLAVSVWPQKEFPKVVQGNLTLAAGEPEMEAVLERLEELRFHRNPLEVLLRFLPQGTRTLEVDPEKDYQIDLFAYDEKYQPLGLLRFHISGWWQGLGRELPLYTSRAQEKGRELAAFLWEMSQSSESSL